MKRKLSEYVDDEAEDSQWESSGEDDGDFDDEEDGTFIVDSELELTDTDEPDYGGGTEPEVIPDPPRRSTRNRKAKEPTAAANDIHVQPPSSTTVDTSTGKYRACRKKFFLTFSRCPATPEEILEHLRQYGEIEKYLIAQETHGEPLRFVGDSPTHIHAFIVYLKKQDFKDSRWADWKDANGKIYHPNDKGSPRSDTGVSKYCAKDGEYITNYWTRSIWEQASNAPDIQTAVKLIKAKAPKDYWLNSDKIHNTAARLFQSVTIPEFKLSDFKVPKLDLRTVWLVWGTSGSGKTNFALSHFKTPLKVEHIDALKHFDPSVHDGIVFDDIDLRHWPITSVIHMLDMDYGQWIHCRYYNGYIPAKIPRIFCFNDDNPFYPVEGDNTGVKVTASTEQIRAVERRIARKQVTNKLF